MSDGSAAAVIVRAEDAYKYTDKPLFVKALSFIAGPAAGPIDPDYDYTTFPEAVASATDAYAQAGIKDPRAELAMAEVHDCFTPTELVLMEDLGFAARGTAWKEVLAGTFDLDGELAVNPDGGLKSFGHPIGASGLRMLFECWLQLRGEAGKRQIASIGRGRKLAPHAQSRRRAGGVRVLRQRGGLRAERVAGSPRHRNAVPLARVGGGNRPASISRHVCRKSEWQLAHPHFDLFDALGGPRLSPARGAPQRFDHALAERAAGIHGAESGPGHSLMTVLSTS